MDKHISDNDLDKAVSSNQRLPNPFRRPLKSSYQPHVRTNAIQNIPVVQELLEMNQIKWPTGFNKEDFVGNGNYGAVCLDSSSSTVVKFPHEGCEEAIRMEIKIYERFEQYGGYVQLFDLHAILPQHPLLFQDNNINRCDIGNWVAHTLLDRVIITSVVT
ncbi:hypothetical protein V8E54_000594 [Elaphomyces granulatus]